MINGYVAEKGRWDVAAYKISHFKSAGFRKMSHKLMQNIIEILHILSVTFVGSVIKLSHWMRALFCLMFAG